jgi:enoyl-CoA hydratase
MHHHEAVIWERQKDIGIIKFNQPETLNALSSKMKGELLELLGEIKVDSDLKVIILTGTGKAFSAGGNLQEFMAHWEANKNKGGAQDLFANDLARAMLSVEVPAIAAVNGPAVGGGMTLSLCCDIRIAAEEARFGAVFVKAGLAPEYGSSFLLARAVGLTRASELILTGRIIDASEALQMGLVSEVLPGPKLMERAMELAHIISSHPPLAVRMAKRVLRHGLECTLSQALDYEELAETHCFSSMDHYEAVKSMVEKRSPEFIGR